jgi:hypothetical protein
MNQLGDHEVRDDLESFFWVIVFIMVTFKAPSQRKTFEELGKLELDDVWWNPSPEHWARSAKWKLATVKMNALWFDNIAKHFSSYFDCWAETIDLMRKTIFSHYNEDVHHLTQMCSTDGVTYDDILKILQVMLEAGAAADAKAEVDTEEGSVVDTQIISELDTRDDAFTSLFSLQAVDDHDDGLELKDFDPASYTPIEELKITESLTGAVTDSEIPEGVFFPASDGNIPSRDAILHYTRHIVATSTLDTGELPSEITSPAVITIKRKASARAVASPAKKSRGAVAGKSTGEVGLEGRAVGHATLHRPRRIGHSQGVSLHATA